MDVENGQHAQTDRVCCVAILFHPPAGQVDRLLDSLRGEVQHVFLVDNTPGSTPAPALPLHQESLTYLPQGRNTGLAAAQNVGLQSAMEAGFTHALILDQDSIVTSGTVQILLQAEQALSTSGLRIAAVGVLYGDTKTGTSAVAHRYHPFRLEKVRVPVGTPPLETDWLISSGSLIRCSVLREVGLMREDLFIDAIDTEWGLRAKSMDLLSFLVPAAPMEHTIGDKAVTLMGRKLNLHNELRSCYIVRNTAFLLRLPTMGWRWRSYGALSLFYSFATLTWTAERPLWRAGLLLKAIWSGFRGRMGAISLPG